MVVRARDGTPLPSSKRRQQHGLQPGIRAIQGLGERALSDALDTPAARELKAWRDALVRDMGGIDSVSAQQYTVLEQAARTKVILDAIDGWLFQDTARVLNKRNRSLSPIVVQRQRVADGLVRYLTTLGLDRKAETLTLEAYIESEYGEDSGDPDHAPHGEHGREGQPHAEVDGDDRDRGAA